MRDANYCQSFSGRKFWPLDPLPEDFCILDIAHALSHICRFGGHGKRFYSVGQHCLHVSRLASTMIRDAGGTKEQIRIAALTGLLHDASEAYLGDIITPFKRCLPEYRVIEHRVLNVIFKKFGVPYEAEKLPPEVMRADAIALATERQYIVNDLSIDWHLPEKPEEPKGQRFFPSFEYKPAEIKAEYASRYLELTGGAVPSEERKQLIMNFGYVHDVF